MCNFSGGIYREVAISLDMSFSYLLEVGYAMLFVEHHQWGILPLRLGHSKSCYRSSNCGLYLTLVLGLEDTMSWSTYDQLGI